MIKDQDITDRYSIYNGDCIQGMTALPENSIDMSIYSPPFASMYVYSSSIYDLGNNKNYPEFLDHYRFVVKELFRITKPGRVTCVHCMDIPRSGDMGLIDFPGDIIRMHQDAGFRFWDRKNIWKEPLRVAIRTRQRALMHMELCKDTTKCRGALADYLLIFKKRGENQTPVQKPYGITEYDGDLSLMNKEELAEYQTLKLKYIKHTNDKTNRLSQFIWRRYASASWEDVRANESLCYKPARDKDDDRHVCPIPLDIPNRAVIMYTNPGEVVLTPFMGVGSEVYSAVSKGRLGIGWELKPSYFRQAVKNLQPLMVEDNAVEVDIFSGVKPALDLSPDYDENCGQPTPEAKQDKSAKAFLNDIVSVCEKHGLSLGHQDDHGAFQVRKLDKENIDWLMDAELKTDGEL